MPQVQNTSNTDYISQSVGRVNTGETVEAPRDQAEYLVEETGYFEYVDEPSEDTTDEAEPTDDSEESESEDFDGDAWLEQDFRDREARVRDGDVDKHLDAIAEEETSDTVLDAIGERRAELEG